MLVELNEKFTVEFSCKDSATSPKKDYAIEVDISKLSPADIQEWMSNNGIIVYLQDRIRKGKLETGTTVVLHSPGTRSTGSKLDSKALGEARTLCIQLGRATANTSDAEVEIAFRKLQADLAAIKKLSQKKS